MPTSIEAFRKEITALQEDILRDYPGADPDVVAEDPDAATGMCQVLHYDLDLPQTVADNADKVRETIEKNTGKPVEDGALELTQEHQELHQWLYLILTDFAKLGALSPAGLPQVLATMFVLGRRYGLREASQAFGDITSPSMDDLSDLLGGSDTADPRGEQDEK